MILHWNHRYDPDRHRPDQAGQERLDLMIGAVTRPMSHRIFVYGTLKRGFANHPILERGKAEFKGIGETKPDFTLLNLGAFPGLLPAGNTSVHGELFEVDDDTLKILDQLEGHPNFYRRMGITLANHEVVEAYVLPETYRGQFPVVEDGRW